MSICSSPRSDTTRCNTGRGDGAWNSANAQWLNRNGEVAAGWAGNQAVFKNQPGGFGGGTITVAGMQQFKGLQFVDDGYRLEGSGQLVIDGSERGDGNAEIRVLANSAEISTEITGSGGITKTDAGTLVLSGNNSYQGSTHILGGAVSIASDRNLGATGAGILLSGGTLATTADMAIGRNITLAGNGASMSPPAPRWRPPGRSAALAPWSRPAPGRCAWLEPTSTPAERGCAKACSSEIPPRSAGISPTTARWRSSKRRAACSPGTSRAPA